MIVEALLAFLISFVLFAVIVVFFIKHQQRVPYYQMDAEACVRILRQAVEQELLEREWHIFIGMQVRYDNEIETLRGQCIAIDELHAMNTRVSQGMVYVVFSQAGLEKLAELLDEWQHKVDYLA
ncbi:hypothetical protein [Marinomonas ostreistagni]|uniref:hypothetical protein n=1 Tax=Marinomonas ostreistagni TaxID=359209 RepID=UPI0019527355|nr:hypothetical protein [Marinomonas ostreistagni]MBM6552159.1 hypothetical protein [Marinomonas ostreistagni]